MLCFLLPFKVTGEEESLPVCDEDRVVEESVADPMAQLFCQAQHVFVQPIEDGFLEVKSQVVLNPRQNLVKGLFEEKKYLIFFNYLKFIVPYLELQLSIIF